MARRITDRRIHHKDLRFVQAIRRMALCLFVYLRKVCRCTRACTRMCVCVCAELHQHVSVEEPGRKERAVGQEVILKLKPGEFIFAQIFRSIFICLAF